MTLKERAARLKRDIPALFLCLKSPKTPLCAKLLAGLTVAYALSPVDLIPDFIPVLGWLDDVILLPALIALTVRLLPPEEWAACREKARREAAQPRKRWYFALPVAAVWLLVLVWLLRVFFS